MYRFTTLLISVLVLMPLNSAADMIPMRQFILLSNDMTEAEVLYRVGRYDYESVYSDGHHGLIRKVWYYIPNRHSSNAWITEIVFNKLGRIKAIERYRAKR